MNWAPEVVRVEMDYRIERGTGLSHDGTTLEHLRAVKHAHRSWWSRHVHHRSHQDDETEGSRAA